MKMNGGNYILRRIIIILISFSALYFSIIVSACGMEKRGTQYVESYEIEAYKDQSDQMESQEDLLSEEAGDLSDVFPDFDNDEEIKRLIGILDMPVTLRYSEEEYANEYNKAEDVAAQIVDELDKTYDMELVGGIGLALPLFDLVMHYRIGEIDSIDNAEVSIIGLRTDDIEDVATELLSEQYNWVGGFSMDSKLWSRDDNLSLENMYAKGSYLVENGEDDEWYDVTVKITKMPQDFWDLFTAADRIRKYEKSGFHINEGKLRENYRKLLIKTIEVLIITQNDQSHRNIYTLDEYEYEITEYEIEYHYNADPYSAFEIELP